MKLTTVLIFAASLSASHASVAGLIGADPAYFASGTDVSHMYEGVTLSTLTITERDSWVDSEIPELAARPIYSQLCSPCAASTNGQYVFSPTMDGYYGDNYYYPAFNEVEDVAWTLLGEAHYPSIVVGATAFMATFDHATNYAQIIGGGASNSNFYRLDAWGVDGSLLATCVAYPGAYPESGQGCFQRQLGTTTSESAYTKDQWALGFQSDIANISFVTAGGYGGGQYVKSLSFSVSEPSSVAILGAGFFGLLLGRKYRMQGDREGI